MFLALRNLVQDKLRLLLSVVGIALAVMLILFLLGLRTGIMQSTVAYLDHAPGSVTVLPRGVQSTSAALGAGQFLPQSTAEAIARTDGVARVSPVVMSFVVLELHGKKEVTRLVGYDPALGGGPWSLARGRDVRSDDEVVLDRVLADRHHFRVGDALTISGRPVQVVGLANGASSMAGSLVFARKPFVESLLLAPASANLLLVTATPGTSPVDLLARLRAIPGTTALRKSQVITNDRKVIANIFDQVIYLMVAAAFIVGALVVGMVIYTATIERRGEYGIIKAIGARNGVLYRVVLWQALAAAALGVLAGIGFAFAMGWLVTTTRPQFAVAIAPSAILATLAAALVMALAGALVPARAVTRLAPAQVFRR